MTRRYLKRIYRVPKHRGAVEAISALLVKSLVKHGWPAAARLFVDDWANDGFVIYDPQLGDVLPPDFLDAISIAVRILGRTYGLDLSTWGGVVTVNRSYTVSESGQFREVKK